MRIEESYLKLLDQIAVSDKDIRDAREKREAIREVMSKAIKVSLCNCISYPAGALAAGTQIKPLNDVDVVIELETFPDDWRDNPQAALNYVVRVIDRSEIKCTTETRAHAVRITYPDKNFDADVVIGVTQSRGILIPECKNGESPSWIATDPKLHSQQVRDRNRVFSNSAFSQQIRIIKYLNRKWKIEDGDEERKPLSSFHVTALALEINKERLPFSVMTPQYLEEASNLIMKPLDDPAGIGKPLEAKDPQYASALLASAGAKLRETLRTDPQTSERLFLEVFGDFHTIEKILGPNDVSVTSDGMIVPGNQGGREIKSVRSYGQEQE